MPTLRSLHKRLGSVRNTQQITKAMKMVSASKLRKSQEALFALRPYAYRIIGIMEDLRQRLSELDHPLLVQRSIKKVKLLIVSSDRGLCGSFNSNIIKRTELFLRENSASYQELKMDFIGKKAAESIRRKYPASSGLNYKTTANPSYEDAAGIANGLIDGFVKEEFDAVYVIYNEFKSVISQKIIAEQLLPVIPQDYTDLHTKADYLYEPGQHEVLDVLLPKFVKIEMFRILLESTASEHGARMAAMENATRSAGDMIKRLSLVYNRQRQAGITTELMEIVGGKEALDKG